MPTPRSTTDGHGDVPPQPAHTQACSPDGPDHAPACASTVTSALGAGVPAAGVVLLPGDASLAGLQELAAALWGAGD
jgi:hypothetical protein